MSKYLEINECLDCPFFEWDNDGFRIICIKTATKIRHIDPIPDWCPLPNAPEGAHCADTPKTE